MADNVIPAEARQFLITQIDSIAQLEALLWLRAHAGKAWNASDVARQLYIANEEATILLEQLAVGGLITIETAADLRQYVYHPTTTELDTMVAQVDELYRRYLIPVTNLIHSKPKRGIAAFADAFRLRKDKP